MSANSVKAGQLIVELQGEQAMVDYGSKISAAIAETAQPIIIFLSGDLGAGRTTLSRGILLGLGHRGSVKGPTYTLVEPYDLEIGKVYHFDLYRLFDPEELEHIGFSDYLSASQLSMIEWPENGHGYTPPPDLAINISQLPNGRSLIIKAMSHSGENCLQQLQLGAQK